MIHRLFTVTFISAGKLYIELPFRVTLPNTTDVNNVFGRTDDRVGIYNVIMDALRRYGNLDE